MLHSFGFVRLSEEQEEQIIATLFEQLLIFDQVIICTNLENFTLYFLINKLGINTVEKLFDYQYLKLLLWTPKMFTTAIKRNTDGSWDETTIMGKQPLVVGSLVTEDIDPELNIKRALSKFSIHRERKRIFTKSVSKSYLIPNGSEFSVDSARFIIDAYKKDTLKTLGLPFDKEPKYLSFAQRQSLLRLGHHVLETAIMSKYNLKGYDCFENSEIYSQNLIKIGKAYNISENTSTILKLDNLPDLRSLYLSEKLNFDDVFRLRNLSNVKYYRKWINNVGEEVNALEITREYINEIKGTNKFFESNDGKFVRNLGMFGINIALGEAIAGITGAIAGFGLSLLDTFVLENILKGNNPSMFINEIRKQIDINNNAL